ncbi:unnamed protein product [Urochloa humidicola]
MPRKGIGQNTLEIHPFADHTISSYDVTRGITRMGIATHARNHGRSGAPGSTCCQSREPGVEQKRCRVEATTGSFLVVAENLKPDGHFGHVAVIQCSFWVGLTCLGILILVCIVFMWLLVTGSKYDVFLISEQYGNGLLYLGELGVD